jgi:hypothetical protein
VQNWQESCAFSEKHKTETEREPWIHVSHFFQCFMRVLKELKIRYFSIFGFWALKFRRIRLFHVGFNLKLALYYFVWGSYNVRLISHQFVWSEIYVYVKKNLVLSSEKCCYLGLTGKGTVLPSFFVFLLRIYHIANVSNWWKLGT